MAIQLFPSFKPGATSIRRMLTLPSRKSSKHFHATGKSKAVISDAFRCPGRQKYTLLLLRFAYRVVVLLIELFVERTCFVFLSHCSLFKQFLLKSGLFVLLHFAYQVVNLLKILLYLSRLSCLVCYVGSLPDLVITQCALPFKFILMQNSDAIRC